MYYKVMNGDKVIDVLNELIYLAYQEKHGRMVFCDESKAQAIFSSDRKNIWHEETLYDIPVSGYETVRLEEIDKHEYDQLRVLGLKSVEEILDEYTLLLLKSGVI